MSDTRVAPHNVRYRERLWVPWWWWPPAFALAGIIAFEFNMGVTRQSSWWPYAAATANSAAYGHHEDWRGEPLLNPNPGKAAPANPWRPHHPGHPQPFPYSPVVGRGRGWGRGRPGAAVGGARRGSGAPAAPAA
ncbi:DUF3093 family protein, partial [Mycobacterium avium]|uniref:DUF3093 family protein n=1 Tax=Mycobacterium avium TaxID=1764 RepID=UPI002155C122